MNSEISSSLWKRILEFESGELQSSQIITLFQDLIDTGHAWRLQGYYGRTAHQLINDGLCHRTWLPAEKLP